MKILIVDDDHLVCEFLYEMLQQFGYEVAFILRPDFLLPRLAEDNVNLILLDVHMPKIDGLTLLKQLKANSLYQGIPVIMLTANVSEQMLEECFAAGAEDFITKPVSAKVLKARIQAIFTTQQSLQKLRELNDMKTRFISMVSHEFRTPLSTILLAGEMLEKYADRIDEKQRLKQTKSIRKMVLHLSQLLEDVIVISKAELGKLRFQPSALDLESFCRELIEEAHLYIQHMDLKEGLKTGAVQANRIVFSWRAACSQFMLDESLLRYILINLLTNALKYSPQDKTVYFEVHYESETLIFRIHDQGIGIPQSTLDHLFEPFQRASNVGKSSGTGLGLTIVKRAVDQHGGTIQVESKENVGTTITVMLPIINDQ